MKRKSFSVFFWIFVVLAVIFLFFFMRRNKEGFFWGPAGYCPRGDISKCNKCYNRDGTVNTNTTCRGVDCVCAANTSTTKPQTAPSVKTCPTGYRLVNGSCQATNWSN